MTLILNFLESSLQIVNEITNHKEIYAPKQ